jgi:type II secretion system protein H
MSRAGWKQKRASGAALSRRSGFTLIELMVVVVVMAILAGAVAPSIVSATRRTGLDATARKLADLLDFACAAAVARRQPVTVNLDAERHVCWAVTWAPRLPWLAESETPEERTLVQLELPERIGVALVRDFGQEQPQQAGQAWETIRFAPDGTAEDVDVELRDDRENVKTIRVLFATGEVRMVEPED